MKKIITTILVLLSTATFAEIQFRFIEIPESTQISPYVDDGGSSGFGGEDEGSSTPPVEGEQVAEASFFSSNPQLGSFLTDGIYAYGNAANTWNTAGQADTTTGWVTYDMGSATVINTYELGGTVWNVHNPVNWTFEGSQDNVTWTVLESKTNQEGVLATALTHSSGQKFAFNNSTGYQYYKFEGSTGGAIPNTMHLPELKMHYETPAVASASGSVTWGTSAGFAPIYVRELTPDGVYASTGSIGSITGMPGGIQMNFVGQTGSYFFLLMDQESAWLSSITKVVVDGIEISTSTGVYTSDWYGFGSGWYWSSDTSFTASANYVDGSSSTIEFFTE